MKMTMITMAMRSTMTKKRMVTSMITMTMMSIGTSLITMTTVMRKNPSTNSYIPAIKAASSSLTVRSLASSRKETRPSKMNKK